MKNNKFKKIGVGVAVAIGLVASGGAIGNSINKTNTDNKSTKISNVATVQQTKTSSKVNSNKSNIKVDGNLKVHYINVGQGDSILIQQGEHNMLIDAGTNASEQTVVNYLNSQKVKSLEYVIGTHPHEDHIGGLDKVIDNFQVGKVIMPKVTNNTKTFRDVLTSIKRKNLKITTPKVGDNYFLGNANFTILAPNSLKYDKTNNYSVVARLKFGNNSFIFTGDAEDLSEGEILQKQLDISSDVLKVGHHGSRTSTTQGFLNKVNPKYAVISCGKGNKYGHPTQETLNKLKAKNVKLYRTDECGNVIATSDGNNITFNCKEGSFKGAIVGNIKKPTKPPVKVKPKTTKPKVNTNTNINANISSDTVYVSKSGKKYHRGDCSGVSRSKRAIGRQEAINSGYTPCGKCNP